MTEEDHGTSVSHFEDHDIDNKVFTANKRLEKLKLELDDLNKIIAKSEVQVEHDRSKFIHIEKKLNES